MAYKELRALSAFMIMIASISAMMRIGPKSCPARYPVTSYMRLMSTSVPPLPLAPPHHLPNNGSTKDPESSIKILETFFPLAAYPTAVDLQVIEQRQIGRTATAMFGVENTRCKHGFPQAYVQYPVGGGVSSGMIRLSCPHLVKSVDEMESDGALNDFDAKLADEETGGHLRDSFMDTNLAWRAIRQTAVSVEDRLYMDEKLGIEGSKFLMESGIIGCTIGKLQVKCLHAHIGDHLMRGTNKIGAEALEKLESRGVDVKGCDNCWQQCNIQHTPTTESWWYSSPKNKSKLVQARLSRVAHKKFIKIKKLREADLELEKKIVEEKTEVENESKISPVN